MPKPTPPDDATTVTAVAANGHSSIALVLSSGTELFATIGGGATNKANAANRDVVLAALRRSLKA
jgi:hypothetical protein